jgi:hypothetical protein
MAYGKKEFNFYTHPLDSLLFFDIETVAKVPELMEDTPLFDSFEYKMRYAEEAQRKDFSAYNMKALYASKAALYPEFGKIVAITIGKIVDGHKLALYSFSGDDEASILTRFFKALSDQLTTDPELVLCGVNLKFFDLRYCFIRAVVNQIEPVKGHINLTGLKPWEVRTCDITDVWKQTSMYNAPLICMAECLGLPSPKSDIDGSQVSETYWKEGKSGLHRITEYCERDVFTTANVVMRLRFQPLLEMVSGTKQKAPKKGKAGVISKEAQKEPVEVKGELELGAPLELPPLLQRSFNTGHLTPEDEATLIKKTRKSSRVDRTRLLEIVQAIQGKEPLDENFVNQIMKK